MADKQALIDALNGDLAYEYQAVIMYTTYSAQVTGQSRLELRAFFQSEIPDELGHAQFLAEKVASLGGIPTTTPVAVPAATSPKQMLQNIMDAEQTAIKNYSERAEQARQVGEIGLSVELEDMVRDETGHYEETKKLVDGWK